MSKMFHDLMTGLVEVEAYLSGKGVGHRVHVPEAVMRALGRERVTRRRTKLADAQDVAVSRSRLKEKGTSLGKVKAKLIATGKLAA